MVTAPSNARPYLNSLHRDPVFFAAIIILLAAFFACTTVIVGKYRQEQARLGKMWFERGEKALQNSQYAEAVDDFRDALVYSHDGQQYRLRLAEALIATNHAQQARSHLLNLLEAEPGDGEVNLQLARLAAKDGDLRDAQRYYQGAIYGVWRDDPLGRRIDVRFELAEFLIAQNEPNRAKAALVALATSLPDKRPDLNMRLAHLFVKAGDYNAALEQYKAAVTLEPESEAALAGAGEAAFHEQEYDDAQNFLQRAVHLNSNDTHSADLLKISTLVEHMDPFQRGLNSMERAARAVELFKLALSRLEQCQPSTPTPDANSANSPLAASLDRGKTLQRQATVQQLRSNPDLLEIVTQWAFSAEENATPSCGAGSDEDEAVLRISKLRQKEK